MTVVVAASGSVRVPPGPVAVEDGRLATARELSVSTKERSELMDTTLGVVGGGVVVVRGEEVVVAGSRGAVIEGRELGVGVAGRGPSEEVAGRLTKGSADEAAGAAVSLVVSGRGATEVGGGAASLVALVVGGTRRGKTEEGGGPASLVALVCTRGGKTEEGGVPASLVVVVPGTGRG